MASLEGAVADEFGVDAAIARIVDVLGWTIWSAHPDRRQPVIDFEKLTSCIRPYMMGDEALPPLGATTRSIADDNDTKAIAVATTADLVGSNMTTNSWKENECTSQCN